MTSPGITAFFNEPTSTFSYLVRDPLSRACAVIDSVLDFDYSSGRTRTQSADAIIEQIRSEDLELEWILETHVHADHLTAAAYIQERLGGRIGIGAHVSQVQKTFAKVFNTEPQFQPDGSQFDHLFRDEERFRIGTLEVRVLHTPGHTPACVTYVMGDAAFVGDTLFMPDYGTARCDFPGGDARAMYRSIRRILALPPHTRLFMCHDYKAPGRDQYLYESTVAEQRARNVQIHEGITEDEFTARRQARDAQLDMPRLILPSVQVNMRAGRMPPAEANGVRYLKVPLNLL